MKMIILAGGQRSTISDEPEGMPKPMLPVGGRPILWHIMKHASLCGISDFIICGGYKIEMIKEYFLDFYIYQSDICVDIGRNTVDILDRNTEDWKVTIVDTGLKTRPVMRICKVLDIAGDDFFISYGDCLTNISLDRMLERHEQEGKLITAAVAKPAGRKMPLNFMERGSDEWKQSENTWASAGVFVANREAFDSEQNGNLLDIEDILSESSSAIYKHEGFFSTIETLRDKSAAEEMWVAGNAPWMGVL